MQAEQWGQIKELFEAALAQPAQQRAEFLRQACPDNSQLRREVEELLANAGDDSFLADSPIAAVAPGVLHAGAKLGSFEIIGLLGKGGMGEVYRARDLRLGRDVAIKVLPPEFASDAERAARFQREASATSALNHPNILTVYDIGRDGDVSWMACEVVEGESLRQVIKRGPVRPKVATEIAAQIADGLAAAHAAGVVHRDLKAENVMLTRDERVKILDFGVAKWRPPGADHSPKDRSTLTGVVLGTPVGMSPEQAMGAAVDHRSDLFSLGILLFEMLAGKPPFVGDDVAAVMNAVVHTEPADLPAQTPDAITNIVRRLLAKSPDRRFQSAADLAFALRNAGARLLQAATSSKLFARTWQAAASAVMLGLALAVGWLYIQAKRSPAVEPPFSGTLHRLTWDQGLTTDAAISSDGKLVAYASDRGDAGNLDIYVQQVDGSGGAVRLTKGPGDYGEPTFSADNARVAFQKYGPDGGIYELPSLGSGGEAQLLVAHGMNPRFSPDGQFLLYMTGAFYSYRTDRLPGTHLYVLPRGGGEPVLVSAGCSNVSWAAWSAGGQHVVFLGQCGQLGLWRARRDGARPLQRLSDEFNRFRRAHGLEIPVIDQVLAGPPRLLLPIIDGDATYEAVWPVSEDETRPAGPPRPLVFGPGRVAQASASTGGRLALSSIQHSSNLWRLAIDDAGHARGDPVPITAEQSECLTPALSRDGQTAVFVQVQGDPGSPGDRELRVMNLATRMYTPVARSKGQIRFPRFRGAESVTYSDGGKTPPGTYEVGVHGGAEKRLFSGVGVPGDWSADRTLCLTFRADPYITAVDAQGSAPIRVLEASDHFLAQPSFSHDGRWITFNAHHNGHSRIYIAPFRRTQATPINEWIPLTDGAWDDKPRLSADDRLLFFTSERDGFRCIWVQRLGLDKRPEGAPRPVYHFHSPRRSLAQQSLLYLEIAVGPGVLVFNQGETTGNIWLLDPEGRKP